MTEPSEYDAILDRHIPLLDHDNPDVRDTANAVIHLAHQREQHRLARLDYLREYDR